MEDKFICVIMLFDENTNIELERIRKAKGLPVLSCPYHITLGAYVGLDESTILGYCEEFARKHKKIRINLNTLSSFGKQVIYISSDKLNDVFYIHEDFHKKYDEYHGEVGYLYSKEAGMYTPHVTLDMSSCDEDFDERFSLLKDEAIDIDATIERISVYEFNPAKLIKNYDLE